MVILDKSKRLKKELKLLDVYALATGTTLSVGFFLMPGLAAKEAGPAMILSYMIAAIPVIPAIFSMIELSTAMPRAGGTYYFLDRSLGPMLGTIGGLGTWLSLLLKTAFALIGMGAYLSLFLTGNYIVPIAVALALIFGVINLGGAKEIGLVQIILVGLILAILFGFITHGFFHIEPTHFSGFFDKGFTQVLSTAGFVYVSFIGITKVASVSEEVENPERNLPLGMLLSFATVLIVYALGTYIMVGILPMDQLSGNLTPVASVAEHFVGTWGKIAVSVAALLSFASATNAGILSASRYPLAMSRDHLISNKFRKLNKKGIPANGVYITLLMIILCLVFLDPTKIAKLASAFQLFIFVLCCLAVIIMRESQIEAYDPGFNSPFYPWMQIIGIIAPIFLIIEMGKLSIIFSSGLALIGVLWYFYYARARVNRGGAIFHVFERLGTQRFKGLETELRGIIKEKGLREKDPFDETVAQAQFIEIDNKERFDHIVSKASKYLSEKVSYPANKIEAELLQGARIGATPASKGAALPHMRLHHIIEPFLLLVRCKQGVDIDMGKEFWGEHKPEGPIYAIFFLISPEENPGQHLRILAKLAGCVEDDNFIEGWLDANNEQELKEVLLRDANYISLTIKSGHSSGELIGKPLKELELPADTLVAIIRREGKILIPRGSTILKKNDRLTVIGDYKGLEEFKKLYG